ncbi:MAG: hypothetical protein HY049_17110 [Acidobacteria bacterium]|nr:hypothetical protein [Acidobacteriota bacterium]
MDRLRVVVEGGKFATQAQDIADVQRLDEILDGVKWILARTPERGIPTKHLGVWAIATLDWESSPLLILYSFDSERVVLESIIKTEPRAD